jgi:RNA polymerase sigma-70 factor (ECF subfamily)
MLPFRQAMSDPEKDIREMILAFSSSIRQVIKNHLRPNDLAELEDIEQEVRIKLWRFLEKGKKVDNLSSYIKKMAVTTTIDALRKNMKQKPLRELNQLRDRVMLTALSTLSKEYESPDAFLEEQELTAELRSAVESLSENRKQVLRLYLLGLSVEEIGDFYKWDKTKVRHFLYRGIDDLREMMGLRKGKRE